MIIERANFAIMNRIEINLREPFEDNLERALALPAGHEGTGPTDEQIRAELRRIYEFSYGRAVETTFGLVAIAPALLPALAEARLQVSNRQQLLAALREKLASLGQNDRTTTYQSTGNPALLKLLPHRREAPEFWENGTAKLPRKQARAPQLVLEGSGA